MFADILFWVGVGVAGIGVLFGFYLLSKDDTSKKHIITLCLAVSGVVIMIASASQMSAETTATHEQTYQSLKPSLDTKSCPDLEKVMSYSANQTMVSMAKRNYNERCLP